MSFPRYERYKNGGVEWLDEVPQHWTVKRVRHLIGKGGEGMKIGPFGSQLTAENLDYSGPYKVYGQENVIADDFERGDRYVSDTKFVQLAAYQVRPGDILVTMMGTSGRCAIGPSSLAPGIMDSHLLRIRVTSSIEPRFLRLLFDDAAYVRHQVTKLGKGSIMHGLNSSVVAEITIALPPRSEQAVLLSFLDDETAKIDALIEEQRRLIELLKEKRQAVISHAVTKGLNPGAPMKDSGIEAFRDVPDHWGICELKRVFRSVDYGISDSLDMDGAVAILRMGNIQDGKLQLDDLKYTDQVDPDLLLTVGDLLYNRTNSLDLIGKVGLFDFEYDSPISFASYLVRMRTNWMAVPEYLSYLLNTEAILGLARASAFVAIGQCNLNPTRYCELKVALPPVDEQVEIANYLRSVIDTIDVLSSQASAAIELLRERRSTLISAAVTGKIDVRDYAPSQAAELEEAYEPA